MPRAGVPNPTQTRSARITATVLRRRGRSPRSPPWRWSSRGESDAARPVDRRRRRDPAPRRLARASSTTGWPPTTAAECRPWSSRSMLPRARACRGAVRRQRRARRRRRLRLRATAPRPSTSRIDAVVPGSPLGDTARNTVRSIRDLRRRSPSTSAAARRASPTVTPRSRPACRSPWPSSWRPPRPAVADDRQRGAADQGAAHDLLTSASPRGVLVLVFQDGRFESLLGYRARADRGGRLPRAGGDRLRDLDRLWRVRPRQDQGSTRPRPLADARRSRPASAPARWSRPPRSCSPSRWARSPRRRSCSSRRSASGPWSPSSSMRSWCGPAGAADGAAGEPQLWSPRALRRLHARVGLSEVAAGRVATPHPHGAERPDLAIRHFSTIVRTARRVRGVRGLRPRARCLAPRLFRAVRAPAPRAGVRGHRGRRPDGDIITRRSWASSARSSTSTTCVRSPATWRSATSATRPPAPANGRTRSPSIAAGAKGNRRELALAHNGNLVNAVELHAELRERGVTFSSTSDSEIIAALLATHPADEIEDAIADVMPRLQGAFSTVVMTQGPRRRLPRPAGLRPLVLGHDRRALLRRSESCALRHHRRGCCATSSRARWSARRGRRLLPPDRRGRAPGVLRLRVHLLRPARLAHERRGAAGRARADGRDPGARGAGAGGRARHPRARLRQPRRPRLRARRRHAAGRGLHQEPLRRRAPSSSPTRSCASTACG